MPALVLAVLALSVLPALAGCADPADAPAPEAAIAAAAAPPASNAVPTPGELVPADTTVELDGETRELFTTILARAEAEDWQALPYGQIVQRVGEALVGQPYVAGLLDEPEEETLVVTLRAFDCVLYIENVLSLAEMIATGRDDYASYVAGVRELRYRGGEMGAYCSRLHYFTDWIRDNGARGTVEDVTAAAGGERFDKRITFMTENRDAYPKLVPDTTFACIADMEQSLAGVELFYIPQGRIAEAYGAMRPGDIIATATDIGGLDVTHTGFVHKTAERTGFMHASLSSEEVKISPDLEDYVQGIRSQVGVVLVRPLDPRGASGGETQGRLTPPGPPPGTAPGGPPEG